MFEITKTEILSLNTDGVTIQLPYTPMGRSVSLTVSELRTLTRNAQAYLDSIDNPKVDNELPSLENHLGCPNCKESDPDKLYIMPENTPAEILSKERILVYLGKDKDSRQDVVYCLECRSYYLL